MDIGAPIVGPKAPDVTMPIAASASSDANISVPARIGARPSGNNPTRLSVTDWVPSYCANLDPKHHERTWVISSIGPFYRDEIVTDVTRIVKGGKEANVYTCTAHPATGLGNTRAKPLEDSAINAFDD